MSKSFSDADWDQGTPFRVLADLGFFPYSGTDGDLFRKQGLAGWRVSVYTQSLVRIQKKGRKFRGRNTWNTHRQWDAEDDEEFSEEAISKFKAELSHLINHGELRPESE